MRIFVLSNFYPPAVIGGMEYRCQEVVEHLRQRGHQVMVLTSTYGGVKPSSDEDVYRLLTLESDLFYYQPVRFFTYRRHEERRNLYHLKRLSEPFMPDVVFIWGMWNLSRSLAYYLEDRFPDSVVYSLANDWPAQASSHEAYWKQPARRLMSKPVKSVLGAVASALLEHERPANPLQMRRAICVSVALRDVLLAASVPLKDTRVIYPGIDLSAFGKPNKPSHQEQQGLSLLYAGNVAQHKGVHTAIDALAHLLHAQPSLNITLTIVGSGHPDYRRQLDQSILENNLDRHVYFVDQVPREQIPALLTHYDVLLFPSIWEEPFSRIVLEAMAAGLVVIGTQTGGTKEILVDGVNGLTFAPCDSVALAAHIREVYANAELRSELASTARQLVIEKFSLTTMVDQIEQYLIEVLQVASPEGSRS